MMAPVIQRAVPPLGKGGNEDGLVRLVAQSPSDFQYVLPDDLWVHISLRPHGFQDFVLGHDASRMLYQVTQHIKGSRGERHPVFRAPQA